LRETETWIRDVLAGMPTTGLEQKRRRVAADLTELHVLATHLPYDSSVTRHVSQEIQALEDRLVILLPLVDMVADRLLTLKAKAALSPQLLLLTDDVRLWIEDSGPVATDRAAELMRRCETLEPSLGSDTGWDQALQLSLCARLAELIEAVQDSRELAKCIADPEQPVSARIETLAQATRIRALHLDHGLAALSALAAIAAVVSCSLIWIYAAWPDGYVAAMMAGVFSSLFATMDDPTPALRGMLRYIMLGMPIAAIYLFAIFPMIDGFPMLALVLAPVLLWGGVLMAMPANYGKALALMIGTISGMALTPNFHEVFFRIRQYQSGHGDRDYRCADSHLSVQSSGRGMERRALVSLRLARSGGCCNPAHSL
jgi:Predicted membrane protein